MTGTPAAAAAPTAGSRRSTFVWSERSEDGSRRKKISYLQLLDGVRDLFVLVELTPHWRRHLVYGKKNGAELIALFTGRYAALTTMTTLLIGTEVAILFSPADPSKRVREAMQFRQVRTVAFWAGCVIFFNISMSIAALIAILTAWSLNSVIGPNNAHILLRSDLFLHVFNLPSQLALVAVFNFVVTLSMFFFVIAAWQVALPFVLLFWMTVQYLIILYSAAGRILLYSGAIGEERIVERNIEYELEADELNQVLLQKSYVAKKANIHPREQYRIRYQQQLSVLHEGGPLQLEKLRLPSSQYLGAEYEGLDDISEGADEEAGSVLDMSTAGKEE